MWKYRSVISPKGQIKLVSLLHDSHPGIVVMKSMPRCYVCWPKIDSDLESCIHNCSTCQDQSRKPCKAPVHPWPLSSKLWLRLHIDFAGPFMGKMFLIVLDPYSKWIKYKIMSSVTSACTIESLRSMFAQHGLPDTIVIDNGTTLTNSVSEFPNQSCKMCSI